MNESIAMESTEEQAKPKMNWITAPEAADMIGSSVNYINTLVKNRKLLPRRVLPTNGKRLFLLSDVTNYIATMSAV